MKWVTMNQLEVGQHIYGVADAFNQHTFEAPGVVVIKNNDRSCGIRWPWGDFEGFCDDELFKVKEDMRSPR